MIRKRVTILTGLIALIVVAILFFVQREIGQMKVMSEHEVWQNTRVAELLVEESSWLNLAGLFWVEEGEWSMGAAIENDFVLSEGHAPEHVGKFIRKGEVITFEAHDLEVPGSMTLLIDGIRAPVEPVLLIDDEEGDGEPTILSMGHLQWWIISRDGMLGVRVRDLESLTYKNFEGIDSYGFNAAWNVEAQFLPFESPRAFEYPTILGTMREEKAPGVLVFELDGQQFEMIPFERYEGTQLFLVFGDQTNGNTTYEGGRFLYVDMPDERGETRIDFNRSYNPPCAFSPYSTCPRPLRQNRLSIVVQAGEMAYKKPVTEENSTS